MDALSSGLALAAKFNWPAISMLAILIHVFLGALILPPYEKFLRESGVYVEPETFWNSRMRADRLCLSAPFAPDTKAMPASLNWLVLLFRVEAALMLLCAVAALTIHE